MAQSLGLVLVFFLVSVLAHAVEGDACFIDAFFNSSLIRVTPF